MSTNGSKAAPSREQVIREATYYAAVHGWYDTSEAAQRANLLTISVVDMAPLEPLPPNATHQFYVCVNATAYLVMRYPDRYEVEPHDQIESQREERELREAALDTALWYFTGEGAGYHPGDGPEERARVISELLEEGKEYEEEERKEEETHPIIRDVFPDLFLAPTETSPAPRVPRQWSVQIGPHYYCEVGLIGYNEDETPELIAVDAEPDDDEGEE